MIVEIHACKSVIDAEHHIKSATDLALADAFTTITYCDKQSIFSGAAHKLPDAELIIFRKHLLKRLINDHAQWSRGHVSRWAASPLAPSLSAKQFGKMRGKFDHGTYRGWSVPAFHN